MRVTAVDHNSGSILATVVGTLDERRRQTVVNLLFDSACAQQRFLWLDVAVLYRCFLYIMYIRRHGAAKKNRQRYQ